MPRRLTSLLALVLACAGGAACAQGLAPASVFVQGGSGEDGVRAASVGVAWPWAWRSTLGSTEVTAQTELFASNWRARNFAGSHTNYVQLNLVPVFRFRPSGGQSPWFFEAGIGLSVLDKDFVTPTKTFGTRWNFSDNFAVGRSFGDKGQHELSLRWQHSSNAGIKKPNPGLDLILVRYGHRF